MKNTIRTISATIFGLLLINLIAWSSGNKNFYTHKIEEGVSPLDVVEPDLSKYYFNETTVIETVTPSIIPLFFESKFDTISTELKSR